MYMRDEYRKRGSLAPAAPAQPPPPPPMPSEIAVLL